MCIPPFAWKNKYVLTHGHMTLVSCGSKSNLVVAKNELPPIPRMFIEIGYPGIPILRQAQLYWCYTTGDTTATVFCSHLPIFPSTYLSIDLSVYPSKNRFLENNKHEWKITNMNGK